MFRIKNLRKYRCEYCDYSTCKNADFVKHLSTSKHKDRTYLEQKLTNIEHKISNSCKFVCGSCNKEYNARNSLWYHKKKCESIKNNHEKDYMIKKLLDIVSEIQFKKVEQNSEEGLITNLLKQNELLMNNQNELLMKIIVEQNKLTTDDNKEFKNLLLELLKSKKQQSTNDKMTINKSNNKILKLNIFLNEICKDAMEFKYFIEQIQFESTDLQILSNNGFKNGYASIILRELKKSDVNMRPIHCSDVKHKVIHVKNCNEWVSIKGGLEYYNFLSKYINIMILKCIGLLSEWKLINYNSLKCTVNDNIIYQKLLSEVYGFKYKSMLEGTFAIISQLVKDIQIEY